MAQIIFAFTINTETQEAVFSGNVELPAALQVLQQLTIADGVKRALEAKKDGEKEKESEQVEAKTK